MARGRKALSIDVKIARAEKLLAELKAQKIQPIVDPIDTEADPI